MSIYFSVATPAQAIYDGKHMLATGTGITGELERGDLVALDAAGQVIRDTGAVGTAKGIIFEPMSQVEFPQSENLVTYMQGKYVAFARGGPFQAFLGASSFAGGVLPAVGAPLYAQAGANVGKLGVTGPTGTSVKLGQVEMSTTVAGPTGGTISVVLATLDFGA